MITRRHFMMASAGLAAAGPRILFAQDYPTRPLSVIVGFSPGGGTDVTARIVSTRMSAAFGQPIVVENKPGAAGTLAAGQVERATPDGYTVLMNASGAFIHSILKSDFSDDPLNVCTPIAGVTKTPVVMLVNNALPVDSVADFVKLAREKPGGLSYGSDGIAGTTQLCGEYFNTLAGIKLLHVPFKGAGQSVVATVAGQVDANFPTLPSAMSMLRAGKVKPLAVSGTERSKVLPDVPTFDELGYKDFDFLCWFGLVGPKGIPADIVQKLNGVTQEALADQKVKESIEAQGMETMPGTAKEWLEFMDRDAKNIQRMAKVSNLQLS
ncbi:MAG TPA: tripartite tricarboxylate transporter substrate binding protein [Burkholderiaceae bacterium]|nr:tripartite tricarboxylate transporter substrate binding protein [Burkholderiaceae bacterium]